jgi:hypothetical protein
VNQDETPEIIGPPHRPMSQRQRVVSLVVAACVAVALAFVAAPRMLDDSPHAKPVKPDATRQHLMHELALETATRTDAQHLSDGLQLVFMDLHAYPADLPALASLLDQYQHTPARGDSIAWYVHDDSDFVLCVEHRTGSRPDAFALYATTVGGIVETDHGRGCTAPPADFAAAEATVTGLTGPGLG